MRAHRRPLPAAALLCTLLVLVPIPGQAEVTNAPPSPSWTQWRGPQRDGHITKGMLPQRWPEKLTVRWRREVGAGHSSPIVAGGRVFVLTRRGEEEVVTALSLAKGTVLWSAKYAAKIGVNPYAKSHGRWPRATPLVRGNRLVTLGANAVWSCFDTQTGKKLWRFELEKGVETKDLFCGTSVSPLFHDGNVIAHIGDDSGGQMVARRLEDGTPAWRTKLEGPGYASPLIAKLGGVTQIVTLTMSRVIAVDASNGKLLWSVPFEDKWNENILTPVLLGDTVIVGGVRRGTTALRPRPPKDGAKEWQIETAWSDRGTQLYMSSPVAIDGVLYGFSRKRRGSLVALDGAKGKTLWTHRERAENAALLCNGSHLFALTTGGDFVVAKVDREKLTPVHRYRVADSPTWAHPVLLPDGVLVKDSRAVVRLGAAK